jgi:hypothetical protein
MFSVTEDRLAEPDADGSAAADEAADEVDDDDEDDDEQPAAARPTRLASASVTTA